MAALNLAFAELARSPATASRRGKLHSGDTYSPSPHTKGKG